MLVFSITITIMSFIFYVSQFDTSIHGHLPKISASCCAGNTVILSACPERGVVSFFQFSNYLRSMMRGIGANNRMEQIAWDSISISLM